MDKIIAYISAEQNITGEVTKGIRYVNMGYNKEELDQMFEGKQDALSSEQIENLNADHSKYLTEHQDLSSKQDALTAEQLTAVNSGITSEKIAQYDNYATNKQNIINDLATIRDGASKGATALQEHQDISGKVDKQSGYSLVSNANIQQITTNKNAIALLNGDSEGSVIKCVQDEIAKVVANAPSNFDTLKEISDWIGTHETSVATMNSAIAENAKDIESIEASKADKEHTHSQYLTEHQDLSDYAKTEDMPIFSATYSIGKTNNGYIRGNVITYDKFDSASDYAFISKATLNNVLTGRGYVTEEQVNGLINSALGEIENGTY